VPLPAAPAGANAPPPLTVQIVPPPDTILAADTGRYVFGVMPGRPARVITTITPADVPSDIVWADTQEVQLAGAPRWNLRRGGETAIVPDGRFAIRVRAVDASDQVSGTIERILVVSRVAVDTAAHPAALAPSAFQPETLRLRRGSPTVLLVGLGIGAAAAMMPTALGNPDLNSGRAADGTSAVIAGTASLAGIVGFLAGKRTRYSAENARANEDIRRRWQSQLQLVIAENRRLLDLAPVRIQVEP
jgi:hypothetical protein